MMLKLITICSENEQYRLNLDIAPIYIRNRFYYKTAITAYILKIQYIGSDFNMV